MIEPHYILLETGKINMNSHKLTNNFVHSVFNNSVRIGFYHPEKEIYFGGIL